MPATELRILVLADEPAALDPATDTTLAIVEALHERGHAVFLCTPSGLSLREGEVHHAGRPAGGLDAVLIRVDPPFGRDYLHATHLLEHLPPRVLVINSPAGLRRANEKLYSLEFPRFAPRSLVAADVRELLAFGDDVGGDVVVKPLDGCGGRGVVHLDTAGSGAAAVLELMTGEGRRHVLAQRRLPEAASGDKRIFLLDGEPVGALLRVPQGSEPRANLHLGAIPALTMLTPRDREIARVVGARCRRDGLRFVGLDVIGSHLTEVNVTSPTGFRELAAIGGPRLEEVFADWLEAAAARAREEALCRTAR